MHQHTDCCILSIKLAVCLQTVGTGGQAADPYTDEVMLLATHALARTSQRNSVTRELARLHPERSPLHHLGKGGLVRSVAIGPEIPASLHHLHSIPCGDSVRIV